MYTTVLNLVFNLKTMAQITNHQTTQLNIVAITNAPIDFHLISIDKIKTLFSEVYDNAKPIITQFPEITIVFDPNNQISVNIIKEQNRIIVTDQNITPYSSREKDNFLNLTKKVITAINNNDIKHYGFNIISVFDLSNGSNNSGEFIKNNFINTDKLNDDATEVEIAGFNITYNKEDAKLNLKVEPRLDPNLGPTKSINIKLHAHFAEKQLPNLTELVSNYKEIYNHLLSTLHRIIEQ